MGMQKNYIKFLEHTLQGRLISGDKNIFGSYCNIGAIHNKFGLYMINYNYANIDFAHRKNTHNFAEQCIDQCEYIHMRHIIPIKFVNIDNTIHDYQQFEIRGNEQFIGHILDVPHWFYSSSSSTGARRI